MYAQVDKSKENEKQTIGNSGAQKGKNVKAGIGFVDNRDGAVTQKQAIVQKRNLLDSDKYSENFKRNHVNKGMPNDKECVRRFDRRNVINNTIIDENSCRNAWKTVEDLTSVNNTKEHDLIAQGWDVSEVAEGYKMQQVQRVIVMRANGIINHMHSYVPVGEPRIVDPSTLEGE